MQGIITTNKLTATLLPNYVIQFDWKEDIEISAGDIAELDQIVYKLVGEKKFLSLAVFPKEAQFVSDAHVQATKSGVNINMEAEAIVANQLAQNIILKWYAREMEQSAVPIQLFKEYDYAKNWLDQLAIKKNIT